jgi:uncharacterized membrane protein
MSTSAPGPTKLGVAPNVGGLLCYAPCCIGLIFSVVAVIMEKENRFLRFHAFQSLLVHGVIFVLSIAVQIVIWVLMAVSNTLAALASILWLLVGVAILGLVVFLMIKAYNGEEYSLPTIGDMARNWV